MTIRVVDLFSGCGGFSAGFHAGTKGRFTTVLALDNNEPAVRTFNQNLSDGHPIAACVDIAEFTHSSEIIAFYLLAFSAVCDDHQLADELASLGLREFVEDMAILDAGYRSRADEIIRTKAFRSAYTKVPESERRSTLLSDILARFRFPALGRYPASTPPMLWDATTPNIETLPRSASLVAHRVRSKEANQRRALRRSLGIKLRASLARTGCKFKQLGSFLKGEQFALLLGNQLSWLVARALRIENFFGRPSLEQRLETLYTADRRVHILAGGPPCQGFSRWGRAAISHLRKVGLHSLPDDDFGDMRNRLFCNYVRFLSALRPDVFLFENVSTFTSTVMVDGEDVLCAGEALEAAVTRLSRGGLRYITANTLVNANTVGIPQNRERFLMLGVRDALRMDARSTLESLPNLPEIPLRTALGGLQDTVRFVGPAVSNADRVPLMAPKNFERSPARAAYVAWIRLKPDGTWCAETDSHVTRRPTPDDAAFFAGLAPGVRWQDLPRAQLRQTLRAISATHHLLRHGYLSKGADRHGDWLARLDGDKPSRAICAHLSKDGYGYIHPSRPRTLSVREAARIQSFPDWYSFAGCSLVTAFTLIGNAVPPLLAARLARALMKAFEQPRARARRSTPSRTSAQVAIRLKAAS